MRGSYVRGASIWNSGNRFITVHSTQYVVLSYNVGYNAVGHGFFLEEGDEVFVEMDHNLGILVNPGKILATDHAPAVFWIQNPLNSLSNNIAVSSVGGSGFEFAIPGGTRDIPALGGSVVPRKLPLLKFEGNETHSNARFGVRVYRFNTSPFDVSVLVGLKAWRNQKIGMFLEGDRMKISNFSSFGNGKSNVYLSGNGNILENGSILGELESVRGQQPTAYPITPKGIVIKGLGNTIKGSWLEGHESKEGVTGADISLGQAFAAEQDRPITALITDTVMNSTRPIILGFTPHEDSVLEVRNYQRKSGDDFRLVRIDGNTSMPCAGAILEMSFVALKCGIERTPTNALEIP